jgi:hypothetical protein
VGHFRGHPEDAGILVEPTGAIGVSFDPDRFQSR